MRRLTVSVMGGIATAVTLLVIAIAGMQTMNQADTNVGPRIVHINEPIVGPPSSPIVGPGLNVVDIAEAEKLVGYKIYTASYLPFNNSLRITKMDPNTKEVTLVYSPTVVTTSTTAEDVRASKGFFVTYSVIPQGFDVERWIKQFVADAPDVRKAVTINGMLGEANEYSIAVDPYGVELPLPAEVIFFRENIQITLAAEFPMAELIKVAESLK